MSATATACGYWRTCSSAWRLPEQLFEAVVHVQLLEENLHQGRRPPERSGRGNRRSNGSEVEHPGASVSWWRLSEQGYVGSCLARGGTRARRRRRAYGRFCLGRLSTRGHGRSWDWRQSGASDCFTASAIVQCLYPLEIASFPVWRLALRYRFWVCPTQNVIWREIATRHQDARQAVS